jgi:4-hydroxy-3-methylbut-2-enyl diphosphate reductase
VNRTLLIQVLATGPTLTRGRVAVLDAFVHDERGTVHCPAAAALAADLGEQLGDAVTRGEVVAGTDEGSVTLCVTYLDRDGRATGLAAAVRTHDYEAIDIVQQTMQAWAATMRTRRVLVADLPDCVTGECPHRRTAYASVLDFTHRGDTVALIADRRRGRSAATELGLTARNAGGSAVVVGDPAEVASLCAKVDPDALSFVIVPGIRIEAAMPIISRLRELVPRLRGQHPDEYCYAASDLHESVCSVAQASERLLVVGGSADEASDVAQSHGVPWHHVVNAADLRPSQLAASTLGLVVASASAASRAGADEHGVEPVLDLLAGLGPLSVRRRGVRTEPYPRRVSAAADTPLASTVHA